MTKPNIIADVMWAHKNHYKSYGDYSVTGLIDTPRVTRLKKRYEKLSEPEIIGTMPSIYGTAVHDYMEKCLSQYQMNPDVEYELERSVYDKISDRIITGKFDVLANRKHMYDFKTCKTWKTVFDPDFEEWHEQQNLYAYLLHRRGIDIETINIIALYQDWQEGQALRNSSYPQSQMIEYELEKWEPQVAEEFLRERLYIHKQCEELPDDELPECTREERWERFSDGRTVQYALMKDKSARAAVPGSLKCNSVKELVELARTKKLTGDSFIEVRYAQRKRCENYCSVNKWCNLYREYCEKKQNDSLNDIIPLSEVM